MSQLIILLIAKRVKEAKPEEKQYKLYDGNGLILCVYLSGKKVWRLDYTDHDKKRKTFTIGDAGLIPLNFIHLSVIDRYPQKSFIK